MGYYNQIPQNSSFKNIYLLDLEGIRNSDSSQEKGMLQQQIRVYPSKRMTVQKLNSAVLLPNTKYFLQLAPIS